MADPFVGQVTLVAFNFAPKGWATCAGQLLPLSQNTALFSLLGTFYGGDGRSTFGLPNLQGSVALGFGQLAGGSYYDIGEVSGTESVTLLASETPSHTHSLLAVSVAGKLSEPSGNTLADARGQSIYSTTTTPAQNMNNNAISLYGGSQPHNNMMPYQCLLWVIALTGVFPARQ
jgi:microcystin-dependent protein